MPDRPNKPGECRNFQFAWVVLTTCECDAYQLETFEDLYHAMKHLHYDYKMPLGVVSDVTSVIKRRCRATSGYLASDGHALEFFVSAVNLSDDMFATFH